VSANAKLRDRAAGIVAEIAGCPPAEAADALHACGGDARAAVLQLVRGLPPGDAIRLAAAHPSLRAALRS
jgi:N-acetylmuramic acid 6-phosphate etherase